MDPLTVLRSRELGRKRLRVRLHDASYSFASKEKQKQFNGRCLLADAKEPRTADPRNLRSAAIC